MLIILHSGISQKKGVRRNHQRPIIHRWERRDLPRDPACMRGTRPSGPISLSGKFYLGIQGIACPRVFWSSILSSWHLIYQGVPLYRLIPRVFFVLCIGSLPRCDVSVWHWGLVWIQYNSFRLWGFLGYKQKPAYSNIKGVNQLGQPLLFSGGVDEIWARDLPVMIDGTF